MQTEGADWKGLRLRPDIVGTEDGLAKYPYIRESRRIQAEFTVLEQHVGAQAHGAPKRSSRTRSESAATASTSTQARAETTI